MSFYKVGTDFVPKGWAVSSLAEFVTAKAGNSKLIKGKMHNAPRADLHQGFSASGADVWSDSFEYDTEGVVISAVGARCGKAFFAKGKWVAVANTHVVIPFKNAIDSKFLWYGLNNEDFWVKSGTAQPFIVVSKSFERYFAIPPRVEQTRIVAKLEELLSELDAGVDELKSAQKKLAQYRQSLLKAAVDGSLTAEWRKTNPPAETGAQLLERILKERRARWEEKQLAKFKEQGKTPPKDWQKKYPEPVQPDSAGLPELPEGWVWTSAEQLCEFITKGTTPPKELDSNGAKVIPFLRVTNLTDTGALDLTDKVFVSEQTHHGFLARSAVYPQDVLMNIVGPPLGQVSVVPSTYDEWNINQAIAIFRAVSGIAPWFICRYLLSSVAQQWLKARSKTTAGQTNLTLEVCRNVPVPLAPQLEQDQLLIALETAISSISQQQEAIALSLKQAAAQRQNILRAAFAGQLVPQDPNDEPASVLLERIRAERAAQAKPKTRGRKKAAPEFEDPALSG